MYELVTCMWSPLSLVFCILSQNHPLCLLGLNEAVWVGYPVLVVIYFLRHGHSFWINPRLDGCFLFVCFNAVCCWNNATVFS